MTPDRALICFLEKDPSALMQLLVADASKEVYSRIIDCPTYPTAARTGDLPQALAALDSDLHGPAPLSEVFAKLYETAVAMRHRKSRGQFFTPFSVANFALSQSGPIDPSVVLDAGAGTATFAEVLLRENMNCQSYLGVENDPVLTLMAAHVLVRLKAPVGFRIWYKNFLSIDSSELETQLTRRPTLLVANPPYVRSHRLKDKQRIAEWSTNGRGRRYSAFSGSANYFVGKGADLMASNNDEGACMIFLMPREAAGSAHYRSLRDDLQTERGLVASRIDVPEKLLMRSGAIALLFVFRPQRATVFKEHCQNEGRLNQNRMRSIVTVRRGLSTGRNEFFVLTDAEARRRRIPDPYLRAVLPTRISLDNDCFTENDWRKLRDSGHPCWVLAIPAEREMETLEPTLQAYLKEGLQMGLHDTPTARRLRTWYALPITDDPPVMFVTYFFRGSPRFVLNEARVIHLTNILGVRPRRGPWSSDKAMHVVEALNKDAKMWFKEGHPGREYRDGLRKIEPKELEGLSISSATIERVGQVITEEDQPCLLL